MQTCRPGSPCFDPKLRALCFYVCVKTDGEALLALPRPFAVKTWPKRRTDANGTEAQSGRCLHGVFKHVLANGSASFQPHRNHAIAFRHDPADRAIPHTKDLRAGTASFAAL